MANEVYARTHNGLANMVSARAATRVLQDTLKAHNQTPDTIDADLMGRLLLGPILSEFEQILPREGLKRNLHELTLSLRNEPEELDLSMADLLDLEAVEDEPEGDYEDDDASPKPAQVPEPRRTPPATAPQPVAPQPVTPQPTAPRPAPSVRPPAPPVPSLTSAQLESMILRFAQIENVKLVAAFRSNGEIAMSRGSGVDLNAVSRFGLMGLRLLARSGQLHSYYLQHTQGQMFLFAFGPETIILVGTPDLNFGTILSTLSLLKEEL